MQRSLGRIPAFVAVVMALFVAHPVRAEDCNSAIVDGAGKLGNTAALQAAIGRLEGLGADVRVRTLASSAAYGGIDAYKAQMLRSCPSWSTTDGTHLKSNLVLAVVAMDKQSMLSTGEEFHSAVGGQLSAIRSERMNPRFKSGDFSGGIANAFDAVADAIKAARQPARVAAPVAPVNVVVQAPAPSGPPPDYSGLWWVLIAGLLLVAAYLIYQAWQTASRQKAARAAAQQGAQGSKAMASSDVTALDEPLVLAKARANQLKSRMSEEDLAESNRLIADAERAINTATLRYGELEKASANNPDADGLSEEQYGRIGSLYEGIRKLQAQAKDALQRAEDGLKAAESRIAEAQPHIDRLSQALDGAVSKIDAVRNQGFKVEAADAKLVEAQTAQTEAEQALANRKYGSVAQICARGTALVGEAVKAAEELPAKRESAGMAVARLDARIPKTARFITDTKPVFAAIAGAFVEGSWAHVRGNGTEAEKRVEAAKANLSKANAAADMGQQEWQKAEELVAQANAWLDEAESFMRSVAALRETLEAAKRDAAAEVEHAQGDVDQVAAYERDHDADVDDAAKGKIAEARRLVVSARTELAKEKPDYLVVLKRAKEASHAADAILRSAQSEVEAAERRRRLAVSEVRDAGSAVSRAEQYIEDHSSDVGKSARSKLSTAQGTLGEAQRATDLDRRIELGQQAHKEADAAYKKAKSDVSDAEDERRRQREEAERLRREAEESRQRAARAEDDAREERRRAREERSNNDFTTGLLIGNALGSSSSRSRNDDAPSFGGWGSSSSRSDDAPSRSDDTSSGSWSTPSVDDSSSGSVSAPSDDTSSGGW